MSESKKLGIPVVAVVDTNNSPEGIDCVIPGNDDATRAIKAYAQSIADAIIEAKGANTVAPRGDEFVEVDDKAAAAKPRGKGKAAPKKETKVETKKRHKIEDKDAETKE